MSADGFLTEVDRAFQAALRNRHVGRPALVILRGPNVAKDISRFLHHEPGFRGAVTIGVNLAAFYWLAEYAVAIDPQVFYGRSPAAFPEIKYVFPNMPAFHSLRVNCPGPQMFFWTEPAELPPGEERYNRTWPRPWNHGSYTSLVALWLAWYLGCNPIACCGADFALGADGRIHGDTPEENADDRLRRHYRETLPGNREKWQLLVNAIRESGVRVEWPGEDAVHAE